jgi:hypothetical protein
MKDKEHPVAPAPHYFHAGCGYNVEKQESDDANNNHRITKTLFDNPRLYEIIDVPNSMAQQQEVDNPS